MEHILFGSTGEPEVAASRTSSKNDFDFFEGKWTIRNFKLKERLQDNNDWEMFDAHQEVHKILHGLGNMDRFITDEGEPFEGLTLRLFNPATRLWSIYWADSNRGTLDNPVVGSFRGTIGRFYGKDKCNGQDVAVVFQWDKTDEDKPVWSQAFSTDEGASWEWNWHMHFTRLR
ncbi:MAG: hypothetical protein J0I41_11810 [Filimonas sp.]|nr:hypothetical protein [Filimonas sp.]